ncbi:MAG: D-alanine--D-alanine ligase [Campylobacteraceae bacterium]|jgi:D-alanine-D-alanine ligase|nr:D-alanine--D-alanine ligase [Campylobacteraceae bacterium]MBT3881830.1 D-alanine--D-alanine ligase [Campylobacteraceae bacterium]MBT4030438.1 D-alanine--D-alanine ligase [Campylobacteraceae bacterium]MBT4179711.1 D-alanine--D-alanine ligase [Campylobacteraceae bacterium]MBT4571892.1 D-alanine--D-alanine ligase [Campylobacteraceae bacterium]
MTLGIIFGSKSFEHEISIVSAITMKKVLKNTLEYIFIDQHRDFYHIPASKINSKLFSSGEYKKYDKLQISQGGFFKSSLFGQKKLDIDTILNLTHGGDGEDGVLASLFEFFNIPFIGPRNTACVVSCDKYITKQYASSINVKTLPCEYFHKDDKVSVEKYPVIIKPTKLGSSIGVSIVKSADELDYALDVAFEYDDTIIIEPFINGVKEYNLAGAKIGNNEIQFSIIEEPQKEEFLDFEKKYMDFNRTQQVLKANISDELISQLKDNFIKVYNNTFDGSLIRCDFFVIDDEVYLNEINPIPGSMANYLFDDFNTLINQISKYLPKQKDIKIDYTYVNQIQSAKGK